MKYVDAILKIKTTIEQISAEALTIFGEGGIIPEEGQEVNIEGWLAFVNVPPLKGYVRIRTTPAFAMALEYIDGQGGSANADLVRVEWPTDADGEVISYELFTVEVDNYDINGKLDGVRMQPLGGF